MFIKSQLFNVLRIIERELKPLLFFLNYKLLITKFQIKLKKYVATG